MKYQHSEAVRISYESSSDKGHPLILLHGFGLTKESYHPWIPHLGNNYRVITMDVFYHGASQRPFRPFSRKEWVEIFRGFLNHLNVKSFSVGGFSLGGRFAIPCALEFPDRCKELFLIGPDAIYKTPWFLAATHPVLRWLFKYYMDNDRALHRLIKRSVRLGVISKYMADFVEKELSREENRQRVYYSWNHFKPLGYTQAQLRSKFKNSECRKVLILGSRDIVIHPTKILPIVKGCGFEVHILERKHHQLMTEETAMIIAENPKR